MRFGATRTTGASSVTGKAYYFRHDAAAASDFREITVRDAAATRQRSSFARYHDVMLVCGGYSDNMVLYNEDWTNLWTLGIRPPDVVPSVALAAGPGITANVICYLRFSDSRTGERSPLSAPSATLAAANQKITYSSLNTITTPTRATHIEGWESRDGSLPSAVWRRQIGVTSVTHAVAAGDLGEAETEDWEKFPPCAYNAVWHDRHVMAGDPAHPNLVYFSFIGAPERLEFSLPTRSGHAVTALGVVNGQLLVQGSTVSEAVTGWTVDDIAIEIVQPNLGCLSHWGLVNVHNWLWIPTHEGVFVSDGSSWFPVMGDLKRTWAFALRYARQTTSTLPTYYPNPYEDMWGEWHPADRTVRFYVGISKAVTGQLLDAAYKLDPQEGYMYWCADYSRTIPTEGGGMGQAAWTFDLYGLPRFCGRTFSLPGGADLEVLTGSTYGMLYREGVPGGDAGPPALANKDPLSPNGAPRIFMVSGPMQFGEPASTLWHGTRISELDLFMKHSTTKRVRLHSGQLAQDVQAEPPIPLPAVFDKTGGFSGHWSSHYGGIRASGAAHYLSVTEDSEPLMFFGGLRVGWMPGAAVGR